jgi:glycosyltransferase involved in cell wall biosynthesis
MRVLITRPQIERGGASKLIIQLVNGLSQRGVSVIVAASGGEWIPFLNRQIKWFKVPLFPSTPFNLLSSFLELRRIIEDEKIDVVNSHHRFSTLVCNLLSRVNHIPVVSTVHEIKSDRNLFANLTTGDYSIVYSEAVKQHLFQKLNLDPNRIFLIRAGISTKNPSTNEVVQTERNLNISHRLPVIACIARISKEKGCDTYVNAINRVLKAGYEAQFLMVGEGPEEKELKCKANELHLGEYLKFIGWRDDAATIMTMSDFLILPSTSEALGLTIMEGWALGKPTIASRVGGIPELIQNNRTGLMVTPQDPNELADAIIELIEDPGKAKRLGEMGNQYLKENLSSDEMIHRTLEVFRLSIGFER